MRYSRPRLSTKRIIPDYDDQTQTKADRRYADGRTGFTVAKTVQTWFNDVAYNEQEFFEQTSGENENLAYKALPIQDPFGFTINHNVMFGVSKRIELVTQFNVTTRRGASPYQTTNYGLGGMVQAHLDPWGYEQGVQLVESRAKLSTRGDYIATFMGWLEDVSDGGGTAFPFKGFEGVLKPTKGSAAFWINLSSCHIKDNRALHGGCPVLKGSKWILNKWIYSWDQWKGWPCKLQASKSIDPFKGMSDFRYG